MKSLWLITHIACACAWLGCVLTEAVFEHSTEQRWENRRFTARLHWATDCWIESPLLAGVLGTGIVLLTMTEMTPALRVKIAFGAAAVVLNALCVLIVKRRVAFADAGDGPRYDTLDRWQHRIGAGVLIGIVGALVIGGLRFAGAVS